MALTELDHVGGARDNPADFFLVMRDIACVLGYRHASMRCRDFCGGETTEPLPAADGVRRSTVRTN